jgi:hypothetical protein
MSKLLTRRRKLQTAKYNRTREALIAWLLSI